MTHLSSSFPPSVVQLPDDRRSSLAADLRAYGRVDTDIAARDAALTRPSVLRRVAEQLALLVPAGTDRLVAGEGDAALATAVAIHSGIPFALVRSGSSGRAGIRGELHPSERVVVIVGAFDAEAHILGETLKQNGALVQQTLALTSVDPAAAACTMLFTAVELSGESQEPRLS